MAKTKKQIVADLKDIQAFFSLAKENSIAWIDGIYGAITANSCSYEQGRAEAYEAAFNKIERVLEESK